MELSPVAEIPEIQAGDALALGKLSHPAKFRAREFRRRAAIVG
jgi:hypothetical protein